MKLLATLSKKQAKPVTSWKEIRDDAFAMLEMINAGKFAGRWQEGFALSHAQVSDNPFDFFVTHKSWENEVPRVVCNARLKQGIDKQTFKEACLSYPFRDVIKTQRFWNIDVEFDVPPIDGIKSFFQFGLTHRQMTYDGLAAFMFQHEIDHAKAIDIFHKKH
jgi:peptide deformylase